MNKEWMPVDTMPEGVLVETKIEDAHGVRNVQRLIKRTREPGRTRPMFFVEGEATYVYYQPTHWRPISASEAPKNGTRKEISPAAQAMIELFSCGFLEHHRCAACGSPVGYETHPDFLAVVFNSACDCSGGGKSLSTVSYGEWAVFASSRAARPAATEGNDG